MSDVIISCKDIMKTFNSGDAEVKALQGITLDVHEHELLMLVGFGVTGVILYMFTYENIKPYAVLKAMGASSKQLTNMVFTQAFIGGGNSRQWHRHGSLCPLRSSRSQCRFPF